MQFFKIISNTLKISVTHFFLIFQVKESKKYIYHTIVSLTTTSNQEKKTKKTMISTLETMFKLPCYEIF